MINDLICKRENHAKEYKEFNVEEQYFFTLHDMINWAKIVGEEKNNKNEKFRILELGTKRSKNEVPTNKKHFFTFITNLEYTMTDYQPGYDVDVVCDLHKTNDVFKNKSFDLILSFSTFEHLKYPQLCAHNLMKLLDIRGRIMIQTHQAFPLHGYKYDYYRFSREALKTLFSSKMNFHTITSYFSYPCAIVPHDLHGHEWNDVAESYLNVLFIGEKMDETPDEYIYDLDVM
jgi:Methyltransferase domain